MRPLSLGSWIWFVAIACLTTPEVRASDISTASLIGHKIANVQLGSEGGKAISLYDCKDKKAIVVVFMSFDCPVSNSYAAPLTEMAKTYAAQDVAFFGICPTDEDAATIAKEVREFRIGFPVYRDANLAVAKAFHARVTPEAFLLDRDFILRYRGRIDDGYAARLKKNSEVSRHDLKIAVEELLAGKPVSQPETKTVGCLIQPAATPKVATGNVTYYRDVLPILQRRCQGCHRPGEAGPFSLMTYKQAVNWAADMKEYCHARKMPPWKPIEGPGFLSERKMTDREIATVAAWVDSGTPAGEPKDAPLPPDFTPGWRLGKPDLVLTAESEFILGPTGRDVFRCFVLPTGLTEDKFVVAYEVRPSNPRAVHHTLHFVDPDGYGRKLEQVEKKYAKKTEVYDIGPGYNSMMLPGFLPRGDVGGWAPGISPIRLPEGVGFFLPKGSDIVMQVHYHRTGRVEKDRTQLGLHFGKSSALKAIQPIVIPARFISIPAGAENYRVEGSIWVPQDCTLYLVAPHMHLLGKKIKVKMTPPDGPTTTLVAIDDWEFNWQEMYFFKEPIRAKAGTRFDVEGVYDNSANNPSNPSKPPVTVHFGDETTNEMCFGFLGAAADKPGIIGFQLSPNGFVLRRPGYKHMPEPQVKVKGS
jgi:peroxiredoxin